MAKLVYVPIKDLAVTLKMERSAALKYVKKMGFVPVKKKTATTGYQTANCLTNTQARNVVAQRYADGYLTLPAGDRGPSGSWDK